MQIKNIQNNKSKDWKIIDEIKKEKLIKKFPNYLKSKRKTLLTHFGEEKTNTILFEANKVYPEIVALTPTFNTPMYDSLIVIAGKMAALKKGMRETGITIEEFVKFNIESTRSSAKKIPLFIRKLGGKIYLSRIMRGYLDKVAKSASANGWPTNHISGSKNDDFSMIVETRNCQMLAFLDSVGEGDIKPYCSFFDFTSAEMMGIGLKQESTIDSGVCKYCFYKKGKVEWPENIQKILAG